MTLLSQHVNSLLPIPQKPTAPPVRGHTQGPELPTLAAPVSQARIEPIVPIALSTAMFFPPDELPQAPLRAREQHELQALMRNMQGIEPPLPKGEHVDLLVPRPSGDVT